MQRVFIVFSVMRTPRRFAVHGDHFIRHRFVYGSDPVYETTLEFLGVQPGQHISNAIM
ncbi:hypothetical protein CRENPOLYSF1_1300002 [Crenothrix polyspora]|uniref:Uncharacterized protein n=1 Tax=Crenothrix polyspora TaxID=360316 RepID=A0A1R4H2E7_9GAMM|nr:hypothetical protein CRENPOLYSF1_1300002 [Crenothrix polyspora]